MKSAGCNRGSVLRSGPRCGQDTVFSPQVHDCPIPFALPQVAESQFGRFMPTDSTGQQEGKQRPITFALQPLAVRCLPECLPLFVGKLRWAVYAGASTY
jgi:hypothetical protein